MSLTEHAILRESVFLKISSSFFAHWIRALPPHTSFKYDLYVAFNAEALPFLVSLCRYIDAYPVKAVIIVYIPSFPSKRHILKKPGTTKGFPSATFDSETGVLLPCEQPVSTGFMKSVLGSSVVRKTQCNQGFRHPRTGKGKIHKSLIFRPQESKIHRQKRVLV